MSDWHPEFDHDDDDRPLRTDRGRRMLRIVVLVGWQLLMGLSVHAAESAAPGVAVEYTLPQPCQVTLNIKRPDGWVVRELVVDQPRAAGAQRELWDGRDNHGRHCPPGDYRACLLTHDRIGQEYITSIGNSGSASPTVTGGGLVFVGATNDGRFRAFDAKTGKQLWESRTDGQPLTTPANSGTANANPMTYTSRSGKQFVGIVAGGNLRVFALP